MQKMIARAARLDPCRRARGAARGSAGSGTKPNAGFERNRPFRQGRENTSESVANAKLQVQKTLDTYNALVTKPSTNMKGDYKKLMKSMDSMNKSVGVARQKIAEMQTAGDVYFSGRAETIKGIKDPQLLEQAKQRLSGTQKEFDGVLKSLKETGDSLEPFRKDLADQITFLGSDLTPSAMTALKPNAEKLNAQGADVFSRADKALAGANAYFQSLKAAQT